jgi:hypothetical protein
VVEQNLHKKDAMKNKEYLQPVIPSIAENSSAQLISYLTLIRYD